MGTVTKETDWGYHGGSINESYIKYKNTSSLTEWIVSVEAYMGVASNGAYYNDGDVVTGNGQPVDVSLICGSSKATQRITTIVGQNGNPSYPIYENCSKYTFIFDKKIEVKPNSSVTINIQKAYGNVLIEGHWNTANNRYLPKVNVTDHEVDYTLTIIYHDGGGTPNTNYAMPYTTTVKYGETYNYGWGLYNTTGSNSFGLRKIGYITNSGWNTKSDGTGKYIDETTDYTPAEIASLAGYDLIQSDVTLNLYPTWTPITYQIKYDSNGGSGTMSNSTHTYDVDKKLSKNTFVKTNYEFLGWSLDGKNIKYTDEQVVKNLTSADESTVYLYAAWGPKGSVMIYTDQGWKTALPFIYTEDGWSRALPYVFNNDSKWQLCNGDFKT